MTRNDTFDDLSVNSPPSDPDDVPRKQELDTKADQDGGGAASLDNYSSVNTESSHTATTPVADVSYYGAAGDGMTNDTQAFVDALNAVSSTGGVVFVPPGEYVVDVDTLEVPRAVTLYGSGAENFDATQGSVIRVVGTGHFGIRLGHEGTNTRGNSICNLMLRTADTIDYGLQVGASNGFSIHNNIQNLSVVGFVSNVVFDNTWAGSARNIRTVGGDVGFLWGGDVGQGGTSYLFQSLVAYDSANIGMNIEADTWTYSSWVACAADVTTSTSIAWNLTGYLRGCSFYNCGFESLEGTATGFYINSPTSNYHIVNPTMTTLDTDAETMIDVQDVRSLTLTSVHVSSGNAPSNGTVLNINTTNVNSDNVVAINPYVTGTTAGDWGSATVLGGTHHNLGA